MDALKLSTVPNGGFWFGVLVDREDRLAGSAFYPSQKGVINSLTRVARKLRESQPVSGHHPLAREMVRLFKGEDTAGHVVLNTESTTSFQRRVYEILRKVPKGKVTTYGSLAKAVDSGPRAAGTAVASNPWTLFVPCHRVVPFSLAVGNYSMNGKISHESCAAKRDLLEREGVVIQDDRILPAFVWNPTRA